jgi:hypothetical protein
VHTRVQNLVGMRGDALWGSLDRYKVIVLEEHNVKASVNRVDDSVHTPSYKYFV